MMKKFDFLLGTWDLDYRVPKSAFSEALTGHGSGTFKRALADKYVCFDYSASFSTGDSAAAHAVFAWDEKAKIYRYWWFEDSGSFLSATCNFVNEEILCLNWHDSILVQSFSKVGSNRLRVLMEHPNSQGRPETVLEVIMTRP